MPRLFAIFAVLAAALALVGAGCGSSSSSSSSSSPAPKKQDVSPAGDIPDSQAFVAYAPPGAGFSVKVPEGWSRTATGGATTFTDKLNAVKMEAIGASSAPTVASARSRELPKLAASVKGYKPGRVTTVHRAARTAVKITYRAQSPADPVTGKTRIDAVERYEFFKGGKEAVLTLSGPKGADNVDPYKIVTESFRWTR